MKQLTLIIIILFCSNIYAQQNVDRTIPRNIMIVGNVIDSLNPDSYENDMSSQIFVFSENDKKVLYYFSEPNGAWGMHLDSGTYKLVFSKLGYKSKMLLVEVVDKKHPTFGFYEIRMGIDLVPGKDKEDKTFW